MNNNKPIVPSELFQFGFESDYEAMWHDYNYDFQLIQQVDGSYLQYLHAPTEIIGIPLKTVGQLMIRYKSITGNELRYVTLEELQAGK